MHRWGSHRIRLALSQGGQSSRNHGLIHPNTSALPPLLERTLARGATTGRRAYQTAAAEAAAPTAAPAGGPQAANEYTQMFTSTGVVATAGMIMVGVAGILTLPSSLWQAEKLVAASPATPVAVPEPAPPAAPAAPALTPTKSNHPVPSTPAPAAPAPQAAAPSPTKEVTAKKAKKIKLFTGNSNPELAAQIAQELGCELGKATVSRFEDGEVNVVVHENVRGQDVYIVQSTCTPVNENLMELLLLVSTMRRASARRITAVIPYYGYARQDRKMTARVPISAADVARLLEAMGVDRVVSADLHCGQIQGFFGPRVPVDNLDGGMVGVEYFGERKDLVNPVIVSPDAGGVYRAKKFREHLEKRYGVKAGLAMIIKQRHKPGEIERMDLVGSVQDSDVIIVDDMIDTAGTLCKAANELQKFGAKRVFAFASHGIFSEPASKRIRESALEEVVVTNTIPLAKSCRENSKIKSETVAHLLAGAIRRIHEKKSISELFSDNAASASA